MPGTPKQGGVTITLGGNAILRSGDIVGGDKITTTATTTQVVDVEALGARLAELTELVRELRRAVDAAPGIDETQRDDVVYSLSSAGRELGAAGEELRALPPGQPVPAALSTRIKDGLADLDAAGKHASSVVTNVAAIAHKLGSLISAVGSVLG